MRRIGIGAFAVAPLVVWACSTYGEAEGPSGTSSTSSSSSGGSGTDGGADAQQDQVTPGIVDDAASDGAASVSPILVADWACDEGTSTKIGDMTGHGHDGLAMGGSWTANRTSTVGSAFAFSSNGDYVSVPANPSFDRPAGAKFTMTAWARADGTPNHWYILDIGFGAEGYGLELLDGNTFVYWDGDNHVAAAPVSNIIGWHHYGVVVDGTKVRTYVDGVPVGNGTGSDVPRTCVKVELGRDVVEPVYMKGAIDQVRFFRGALSDAEVLAEKQR